MKDSEQNGSRTREILINAVILTVLVTVVGLASNVILLLIGWCITLPSFAVGLSELNDQVLWGALALISQIFCCVFCGYLAVLLGNNAAQYRIGRHLDRKFSPGVMLATVGIGCGLHGLMCLFTTAMSISYLFFAGPVLYISRFLAHAEREFFSYDTDSYSYGIVVIAIVIYVLAIAAGSCIGYRAGYRRKIAVQEAKEAEDRKGTSAEKTWSAADRDQASRADEFGHTEEKVFLKTFDRRMDAAYRALNRRRIVKTVLFILAWFAADALLGYLWLSSRENARLTVDTMPFVALLIVPFFPLKLHKRLLGKTFYGEVVRMETKEEGRPGRYRGEISVKRTQILLIRPDNGVPEEFRYPAGTHFDLSPGDRVLKLSAYPHPVPTLKRSAVGCPKCGHASDERGAKKCPWCREKLAQWK